MASDLLERGVAALSLRDSGRLVPLLERYLAELETWNPRYGLVNASGEDLVIKHLLDSLSAWRLIETLAGEGAPDAGAAPAVLDVGSGAGLPGIPLAAALPRISFTLLERSTRRAVFLQSCVVLLGLPNVRVVEADLGRALRVMHPELPRFDVVTFRAFAPLGRFFEDLERSSVEWRSIVAYKGKRGRAMEELAEMGERAAGARVEEVSVPFLDEERCLVVMRRAGAG